MSDAMVVNGRRYVRPAAVTEIDDNAAGGPSPLSRANVAVVLVSDKGGEPKTARWFSNAGQMSKVLDRRLAVVLGKLLFKPSGDPRIPSGAQRVAIVRANPATQATLTLVDGAAADAVVLSAWDWGLLGNDVQIKVENGSSVGKKVTETYGEISNSYDNIGSYEGITLGYTSGAGDVTVLTASCDPNAASPSPAFAVDYEFEFLVAGGTFNPSGWMAFDGPITFEYADPVDADPAKSISVTGIDKATGLSTTEVVPCANGTTSATSNTSFSAITSIVPTNGPAGTITASGKAFSLLASTYDTLAKVRDRITAVGSAAGFSATLVTPRTGFLVTDMDAASAQDILDTTHTFDADLWHFIEGLSGATYVSAERADDAEALPANLTTTNLTGGSNGVASGTDWEEAFRALRLESVRHVVALSTDSAVHAKLKDHKLECDGINERMVYSGVPTRTNLDDPGSSPGGLYQRSATANDADFNFCCQTIWEYDETDTLREFDPSYTAVLRAACEAGRLTDNSIVHVPVNIQGFGDNPGSGADNWTSEDNADELVEHGYAILERKPGTSIIRWVADRTTYQTDDNALRCWTFARLGCVLSTANVREVMDDRLGGSNAKVTPGVAKGIINAELARQKAEREIYDYDPDATSIVLDGNKYLGEWEAQAVEDVKWFHGTAHVTRAQATA